MKAYTFILLGLFLFGGSAWSFGLEEDLLAECASRDQIETAGLEQDDDRSLMIESGKKDGVKWSKGRGCWTNLSIEGILEKVRMKDFYLFDRVTKTEIKVQEDRDDLLVIKSFHTVKNRFPIPTVKWNLKWDYEVSSEEEDETELNVNYGKSGGTSFIKMWKGTMKFVQLKNGYTYIAIDNAIDAAQIDVKDAIDFIREREAFLRDGNYDALFLNGAFTIF